MSKPNLIEVWNFNRSLYRDLAKFIDELSVRYPNATVVAVSSADLAKGSYAKMDKLVLLFTSDPQLNEMASKALEGHDKKRTQVICYPNQIQCNGVPSAVASNREEIAKEMVNIMGVSAGYTQHSTTPSALGSLSKIPFDQREQAKPLGFYVFRSKNKEFNHRMNEIFYDFKESPVIEFNEVKRLSAMIDRPNKLQLLVVSEYDVDDILPDLDQMRQNDTNQRIMIALFYTTTESDELRHLFDVVTSDKNVIGDQLRRLIETLTSGGGGGRMSVLAPIQQYNSSLSNSRAIVTHGALQPQSIMSKSLSPGLRSSQRLGRPTSILMSNGSSAQPQVYVMDFHDSGYKQFYTMLPVNYNLVPQVPSSFNSQKNYLIVPAQRSGEVLSNLPPNSNMRVIIYGNTSSAQPHPAVELISDDMEYIKRYLANNQVRLLNQPVQRSILLGGANIVTSKIVHNTQPQFTSTTSFPNLSLSPSGVSRRDLTTFQNASSIPIRSSGVAGINRPPHFGIPSSVQIPYGNQVVYNQAPPPGFNTSGNFNRLYSPEPRLSNVGFPNEANRPRSMAPYGRMSRAAPLPGPPPNRLDPNIPAPQPIPNFSEPAAPQTNTTMTTTNGGTTKTVTTTTQVKPGNRVVQEIVTTTTIQPRVLEIPIVTKIINENIQQAAPRREHSQMSKVIIKEVPIPVVERRTIDINTDQPTTTEYITQTSIIVPPATTTVKTRETEIVNEHNHLGIDSTLGKTIGKSSRVIEIKVPELSIPEEVVELETSIRRSAQRSNRVVREEVRVHPPDASAAIVQEIREVLPSVDLLTQGNYSRTIVNGRLHDSTLNILNNSRANSNSRVHYRLETNTAPVTTYVKEYVETNVEPSTLMDHVIDQRVRVVDSIDSHHGGTKVIETSYPSRIIESRDHRTSHRVVQHPPVVDHVRVVEPTVKEYTRHHDSSRYADLKALSPHTDLRGYERRVQNGIEIYTMRDRSLSSGKTTEKAYAANDYSPQQSHQYVTNNIRTTEVTTTPRKLDSQTTINRTGGTSVEEITQLIDRRYNGNPIEITSLAPVDGEPSYRYSVEQRVSSLNNNFDRVNTSSRSIYYASNNGAKEYVTIPHSGKVRELSEGERRIRKRSGSLRGSRVQSGHVGTLYLVPDNRKFITQELYKFIGPNDKVQAYYLAEDLRFVRYNEFGTVFVFPIDEAQTNLPGVYEHSNAYIIKQSRAPEGPKELRVTRIDELVRISRELKGKQRPISRKHHQLIFKRLNETIEQVSERFAHYQTFTFFSTGDLDRIIGQLDPAKMVILVVDEVPENIERFRNFSLFSCVVIPKGKHYKAQKARYPKLKWIHEEDVDLICDDIRQEIKRLSSKEGIQKSYSSLKGLAPKLISYYEDTEVQEYALSRLQNRMILSQYHDHSSLTKRIMEATDSKKVVVLNPQFARYVAEIDSMSRGQALIIIYDKQSRTAREHMGNPKVRVARTFAELVDELQIYLQYGN